MPGLPELELAALRESEERFRVLSEAGREALFLEEEGVIREANHAFALLLDDEPGELVGKKALDLVVPESQFDFLECMSRSGWVAEVTVVSRGGARRDVEVSSAPVIYRGRAMRAVTLRERQPSADTGTGRPSEVRLHAALEAAGLGIWDYDPATGLITWSPPARSIFGGVFVERGASPEAFMAQLHPEDRERIEAGIQACLGGQQTHFQAEYRVVGAGGALRWVESSGQVFRTADGAAVRMVGVVADVTQRHEFAAQLLHSQRLEATGRLAGSVAHDFNNLLTIIEGQADLARRTLAPDERMREALDQITLAAERASVLTRQLLIFSRRDVAAPKVIDTNRTVRSAASLIQRLVGADVALVLDLDEDTWPVQVDPVQLEQLLVNLGINARDAMPLGGTFRIRTTNVAGADREWVEIQASDDGVGMTEEVLRQAFEPFFTTKALGQGTGLGLSTCKSIVEHAGGHIRAQSTPGVGTTMIIRLPRSHGEPEAARDSSARELPRGSETVLVVEDDAAVRNLVVRVLTDLGYRVLEAANRDEALRQAREHRGKLDLVLADVVMPGASGPDVAAWVLELHPEARTLLVSGYPGDELRRLGFEPSEAVVLAKPFSADQLAQWVRRVLR